MPRTVIVGDVHGCRAELEALLSLIRFGTGDRLVMVGDLVVRGPDNKGTLDLVMSLGAKAVRGNHEDRLLRWRADSRVPMGQAQRAAIATLEDRHWAFLAALPLSLPLPEHNVRVLHAGVIPGVPFPRQKPRTLMYVRCIGPSGEPLERRGEELWGLHYEGREHIVFGHNARSDPQVHANATGLDTGAVYGGRLTAMVLEDGQAPPGPKERHTVLVSVPSGRRYAPA